jgi:hypothetical protein
MLSLSPCPAAPAIDRPHNKAKPNARLAQFPHYRRRRITTMGERRDARDGSSLHALAPDIPLVWPKVNEAQIIFGSGFALMRPGCERLSIAPRRQLTEALPGLPEDRGLAARPLVGADNHVDVKRVELDSAADAAGLVGGDEG